MQPGRPQNSGPQSHAQRALDARVSMAMSVQDGPSREQPNDYTKENTPDVIRKGAIEPAKSALPHWMGARFNGTLFSYYPWLRMTGYVFDLLYVPMALMMSGQKVGTEFPNRNGIKVEFRTKLNRIEAATFTGLAAVAAVADRAAFRQEFAGAVAAELGENEDKVGLIQMRQSHNPIVESAMDYYSWRNVARFGTSLFFFKGLIVGVLAKLFDVTLERSVFRQTPAYENAEQLVGTIRRQNLGLRMQDEVVNDMVGVIQQSRSEHQLEPFDEATIDSWIPALEELANALISNKNIGSNELVFGLGGGMLIPGDGEQSLKNIRTMLELGLERVAEMRKAGQDPFEAGARKPGYDRPQHNPDNPLSVSVMAQDGMPELPQSQVHNVVHERAIQEEQTRRAAIG